MQAVEALEVPVLQGPGLAEEPEREQSGRGSRAPAVDSHADQMLEYFSKPAAQPLPTRGSATRAGRDRERFQQKCEHFCVWNRAFQ